MAFFRCDISREIPPSLLSLERILETLDTTQEVPRYTRHYSRGTQRIRHNSRRALFFPPHLEMKVHFPASLGKESWRSHRTSRGGDLNLKVERNTGGRATIPKDPDVPIHSRETLFTFTDSTVIRVSTPNTMTGVTVLWHLKRKPLIPMST